MIRLFLLFFFLSFCITICSSETTDNRKENLLIAEQIGIETGLPKGMASSLVWEESRGYKNAIGLNKTDSFCSRGLFQINETNEAELVRRFFYDQTESFDTFNPRHSAIVGCRYLLFLHKKFGNWKEALCAYNWGPGNVSRALKYSDIPLRTRRYADNTISRIKEKPYIYLK